VGRVVVKKGRARPLWCGHPWLMSGAVARVEGEPANGDVVSVVDAEGRTIGFGLYNGQSQIRVRMLGIGSANVENAPSLAEIVRTRIARAALLRRALGFPSAHTTGFRLVNAEGDALPGLTVDRFANAVVAQVTTLGLWRERAALREAFPDASPLVIVAPDDAAEREGIPTPRREVFAPPSAAQSTAAEPTAASPDNAAPSNGAGAASHVPFLENGLTFVADPGRGQKTGFFFDQRDARALVASVSAGARVLDLFTHTGAFALYAARAGARDVTAVDSSPPALALARENAKRNALESSIAWVEDDALRFVMERGRAGDAYDVVVVDPPKLARRDADIDGALDRMRRLVAEAMRVVPNGWLLVSSCSAAISRDALERAIAIATSDAGRTAQIVWRGGPGPDHPVVAGHAEGDYLKSMFLRVSKI
jgi:23S rRNA (cytosine1962-C5)-methyltransferase